MRCIAIGGLIGASCILFLTALPSAWLFWLLLGLSLCFLFFFRYNVALILFAVLFFFAYAGLVAHARLAWQVPKNIENKPIYIQGMIQSIPLKEGLRTGFEFRLRDIAKSNKDDAIKLNKIIKLSWYGKTPLLQVGDTWRLEVKLKRIHGFANPGSFDYAKYLLQSNIAATGYVRSSAYNKRLAHDLWSHPIDRIRQKIIRNIQVALPDSNYLPMITALVVGEKSGLNAQQWQVLQRTGTNHLMVIAGLHIGMVSGLAFLLFSFLWRRSERLMLRLAAQQAAAIAALSTAIFYSALAGFSIPTERATIMIAVFMSSIIFKRQLSLGLGLATALAIVLALHPLAVLSAGFWLSFAAVGVIFYGLGACVGRVNKWKTLFKLQFIVSIGLIPLTLLWFQNASLVSPIANAIVIPIVGFIVVPLSLCASLFSFFWPWLSHIIFICAVWAMKFAWYILLWFAGHQFGAWQHAVTNDWVLLSLLLAVLLLLAPRGWPARWLSLLFLLPLFMIRPAAPKMGIAKFTLLDVGQGLASVVQTANHVLVYDTGAKWGPNFNMGEAVVVPYLRQMGIKRVDMLMISHGDNDHIGGAQAVLSAFPVTSVVTSVPQRFKKGRASLCLAGQHWQWDGVRFNVLYPTKDRLGLDNDSSCVLRVSAGQQHLLLTGDIEKSSEQFLLTNAKQKLEANVIVAPHHGSKTSSTPAFVRAVAPEWVLYPVGYLNRYHFPNQSVQLRYATLGAHSLAADSSGAISLSIGQNTPIKPKSYRIQQAHFWWR